MAYVVIACLVMARVDVAYRDMPFKVMADTVMAHIEIAFIAMHTSDLCIDVRIDMHVQNCAGGDHLRV